MLPIKKENDRVLSVWEPFRDLRRMHDEMDRLFATVWPKGDHDGTETATELVSWVPSVDMYEDKDQIVLKVEIPGVKKEDLSIALTEDTLTIQGERKYEKEEKRENYYRLEGSYGRFFRRIELPRPVKSDAVKAEYKEGILKIVLPKSEESKTREIKIAVS